MYVASPLNPVKEAVLSRFCRKEDGGFCQPMVASLLVPKRVIIPYQGFPYILGGHEHSEPHRTGEWSGFLEVGAEGSGLALRGFPEVE